MADENVVDWLLGDVVIDPVTRPMSHGMPLREFILGVRTAISLRHNLPSHLCWGKIEKAPLEVEYPSLSPLKKAPLEVEYPSLSHPKWHTSRSGAFPKLSKVACRPKCTPEVEQFLSRSKWRTSRGVFPKSFEVAHLPKPSIP
ncbi:hypothetical protein JCGZ_22425 [Jatropha curcas]|uniref:Uncharacterized protein n=1 Tax=Jatropha curcas TaxID=180498 RepID=A0A067JQQ9_JATCU|nr:hypothetical protein JCGZ_22425 [Jatropha curcas]